MIISRYRQWVDRMMDGRVAGAGMPPKPQRTPLTANQHILHLLLTVFTCGLWAPVWFVRALRGNPPRRQTDRGA
jgi:hypothetical protein